jgi:hypothetical protein
VSKTDSVVGRLFWRERTVISELDRKLAATWVDHALSSGELTEEQARQRRARLDGATTRAELQRVLPGLPGELQPVALLAAPRVGVGLWLALSFVDIVIWLLIGLFGQTWDGTWLLWQLAGCGVIVAGLWCTRAWDRRMRLSVADGDP